MGGFCSREQAGERKPLNTQRYKVLQTNSLLHLEEENRKLNAEVFDMQRKLAEKEIDIESLNVTVTTLQNELKSVSVDADDVSKSVSGSYLQKTVHDEDKIKTPSEVTEHQLSKTLHALETVTDVTKFVNRAYNTVDFNLTDDEGSDHNPYAFHDDTQKTRESSVDPEEQLEIERAREKESETQKMVDEEMAMKLEMNAMQRAATDNDILMGNTNAGANVGVIQPMNVSRSTGSVPQLNLPSSNLFRFESEERWDQTSVQAQKKDMEAAMTALLEYNAASQ